jgi:hypothetical protein
MKPKDFRKKLILNKNTIADLNNKGMKGLGGGLGPVLFPSCETCTNCGPTNDPPDLCYCAVLPSLPTGYCLATDEGC